MFEQSERLTEPAQNVLVFAYNMASELGHSYVGSEHLLLGLLTQKQDKTCLLLERHKLSFLLVKNRVVQSIGKGSTSSVPGGLTPRSRRILELASLEACKLGKEKIDTNHILLGLLREQDCIGTRLISSLSASAAKIAAEAYESEGVFAPPLNFRSTKEQPEPLPKTLQQFGLDLTALAEKNALDPVIGRESEIEKTIQILLRRTKNNPILIGDAGVGKTAIVEGLALKIAEGEVPDLLKDKRILSLSLASLIAGTKYRGEFEERMRKLIDEVKNTTSVILFIDEIHSIMGAGSAEGALDAANILKPSLSRSELRLIGATTLSEYKKSIEKDAALARRFQPVHVSEPSADTGIAILQALKERYEEHHTVTITDDALRAAVHLSNRYLPERFLPDKAIDLIDEAAARARLFRRKSATADEQFTKRLSALRQKKDQFVAAQDFEAAAKLRDRIRIIEEKRLAVMAEDNNGQSAKEQISAEDIASLVSESTSIPVSRLSAEEGRSLLHLEESLNAKVVGQSPAVSAVCRAIWRNRAGISAEDRPIGSFLFLGPSGVGKTELCRALALQLFQDKNALIRLDMSEYMEKHSVSKLIGSPPGYVGYDEGGQLTDKIRRKPYCVLLFDEIEKASHELFSILLQVLEDGVLTDSTGQRVSFKNTLIVLTSNIGAKKITNRYPLGFSSGESFADMQKLVLSEAKGIFQPEFLNRLDELIVFQKLDAEACRAIASQNMEVVKDRVKSANIHLQVEESALNYIAEKGYDAEYGARPIRRLIQLEVETPLAKLVLNKKTDNSNIRIAEKDGQLDLQPAE